MLLRHTHLSGTELDGATGLAATGEAALALAAACAEAGGAVLTSAGDADIRLSSSSAV